jgi:hypothetical protein
MEIVMRPSCFVRRALHQLLGHHRAADMVGDGGRPTQHRIRQYHGEFLAAVARGDILALDLFLHRQWRRAAAPGRRSDGRSVVEVLK